MEEELVPSSDERDPTGNLPPWGKMRVPQRERYNGTEPTIPTDPDTEELIAVLQSRGWQVILREHILKEAKKSHHRLVQSESDNDLLVKDAYALDTFWKLVSSLYARADIPVTPHVKMILTGEIE